MMVVVSAPCVFAEPPQPPASLIGTWVLNTAKSTLSGPAPKSLYRTFDRTSDGLLCTIRTVNAEGKGSFAFWEVKLDGSDAPEFSRTQGAKATAILSITRVDDHSIHATAKRDGKVFATGTFFTSPDGSIMTHDMTIITEKGEKVRTVRVYDREP
jgi:hypothetical protein